MRDLGLTYWTAPALWAFTRAIQMHAAWAQVGQLRALEYRVEQTEQNSDLSSQDI